MVFDKISRPPRFAQQNSQKYKTREGSRGAEVWEIKWHTCCRKTKTPGLVSRQCTLILAVNVLIGEVKYFLSNRVPNRDGWSLRRILCVAFERWSVEGCFREVKEEIGFDHFECRGWRCIHRHLYTAILGQLFCVQTRKRLNEMGIDPEENQVYCSFTKQKLDDRLP